MFFIDNQKIGKYIGDLIDSKFNSSRQLYAKYLEKRTLRTKIIRMKCEKQQTVL